MPTNPTPVQAVREDELRERLQRAIDILRNRSLVSSVRAEVATELNAVLAALDARVPGSRVQWKVPCPVCDGRGELREAVQAWDIPGAPVPRCTHCDDGVATVVLATPDSDPSANTASEGELTTGTKDHALSEPSGDVPASEVGPVEEAPTTHIIDLMEALKASLARPAAPVPAPERETSDNE